MNFMSTKYHFRNDVENQFWPVLQYVKKYAEFKSAIHFGWNLLKWWVFGDFHFWYFLYIHIFVIFGGWWQMGHGQDITNNVLRMHALPQQSTLTVVNIENIKKCKNIKNIKNENHQKLIIFEGFRQNGLQIRIQRNFLRISTPVKIDFRHFFENDIFLTWKSLKTV